MDTILKLEAQIGKKNLSTNAIKKIRAYLDYKNQLKLVENSYKDAPEDEKEIYKEELDEFNEFFTKFIQDTIDFLSEELKDRKEEIAEAKKTAEAEAEAKKTAEAEAEAKKTPEAKPKPNEAKPKEKSGISVASVVIGALLTIGGFGAFTYFKNNK